MILRRLRNEAGIPWWDKPPAVYFDVVTSLFIFWYCLAILRTHILPTLFELPAMMEIVKVNLDFNAY
jgi:hypothetical protein